MQCERGGGKAGIRHIVVVYGVRDLAYVGALNWFQGVECWWVVTISDEFYTKLLGTCQVAWVFMFLVSNTATCARRNVSLAISPNNIEPYMTLTVG